MYRAVDGSISLAWCFDKSAEIEYKEIVASLTTSVEKNMTEDRSRGARQTLASEEKLGALSQSLGDLVARDALVRGCVVQKNIAKSS